MRLFGGWLPFIGFREEPVDDELREYLGLPHGTQTLNTFQVAWLGVAVCVPLKPDEED